MPFQASDTIIIAGSKFKLHENLLSGHIVDIMVWDDKEKYEFHIKRKTDKEKGYTTQWILKEQPFSGKF